jgi:hypothetical protein
VGWETLPTQLMLFMPAEVVLYSPAKQLRSFTLNQKQNMTESHFKRLIIRLR